MLIYEWYNTLLKTILFPKISSEATGFKLTVIFYTILGQNISKGIDDVWGKNIAKAAKVESVTVSDLTHLLNNGLTV